MSEQVYIALLDEGIAVWRPVPADKVGDATYVIHAPPGYDPEVETWEFPPESTVVCQPRQTADGTVLAAIRLHKERRRRTA